jgi:hypothetical protein
MPEDNSPTKSSKKIRLITNALTTALKLWLRAQISQVSQLEVEIKASDRQILSGCIPWVSIFASHAVYQGLYITRIKLIAENIQINIGSILKGKPLSLLEIVPVVGDLIVEEKDLNNSLTSELLSTALNDVLVKVLPEYCLQSKPTWHKIILGYNQIILCATLGTSIENMPLEVRFDLKLIGNHELQLTQIQVVKNEVALLEGEHDYYLDIGSDVDIQELSLIPGQLVCRGQINVNP